MNTIQKLRNRRKGIGLLILILFVGAFLFYSRFRTNIYEPIDPEDSTEISFLVKKGETAREIGRNLKEEGLIRGPLTFYLYVRTWDLDEDILSGRFILNKTMDVPTILETLSDPSKAQSILTIQEGLRIRDIDQKLVDLDLIQPGEFIQAAKDFNGWEYYDFLDQETLSRLEIPIEGYIYPDTYFLNHGDFEPHDLIYLAMDNFENKTAQEIPQISRHTVNEIITMASIIENEVFGAEDRQIVSGILWKRLENGWPLGADATLLYITDDRHITASDLELDSPYNTRKNLGLPPGPISNPSLESIQAAMFPKSSAYWFYLTTPDTGEVIYATTNEEHNLNRQKYL